jgi:subtilisin family serine protease
MNIRVTAAVLSLAALAACTDTVPTLAPDAAPVAAAAAAGARTIPGQYIVVLNDDVRDVPAMARQLGAAHGATVGFTYQNTVRGFSAGMSATAAAAMARNPNVAYVEEDQVVTINTTTSQTVGTGLWGLDRTDARSGLNGSYQYTNTGAGVTVYIIDTGIRGTHAEFTGRMVAGFDAISSGGSANDCNGHGTHVAGTVGGTTYGIAKQVKLSPVRVLDCNGSGTWSGVVAGIDWVAANAVKPAVANMSLGGGISSTVDQAVQRAITAGITFAVAAGNGNSAGVEQDACNYSPARAPAAITVGATGNTDTKTSWSNYGNCVDWFAPGAGIQSAWYTTNTDSRTISGTSMASPHVAGAAALYLQANPGSTPQQVRDGLYEATTKAIVNLSKTANNHLLYVPPAGFGAVTTPPDEPTTPPPATTPTPPADGPVGTLTVTGSKSKSSWTANLSWSGVSGTSVNIIRNGTRLTTISNTGSFRDTGKGSGTFTYQVCTAGTTTCTATASITF